MNGNKVENCQNDIEAYDGSESDPYKKGIGKNAKENCKDDGEDDV